MGVFDWLFDNTSLGQNGEENGVNVEYTGGDVRHINEDSKYGYDGKIVSDKSGNTHIYESTNNWDSHSHDVVNKNGEVVYSRDANVDSANHPWDNRKHVIEVLKNMSIEQLEILKKYFESHMSFEQEDYHKQIK